MEVVAVGNDGKAALADKPENFDLSFLPKSLNAQCQSLIESYHELHGYACLPNMLCGRLGLDPSSKRIGNFANSSGRPQQQEVQRNPMKASCG